MARKFFIWVVTSEEDRAALSCSFTAIKVALTDATKSIFNCDDRHVSVKLIGAHAFILERTQFLGNNRVDIFCQGMMPSPLGGIANDWVLLIEQVVSMQFRKPGYLVADAAKVFAKSGEVGVSVLSPILAYSQL